MKKILLILAAAVFTAPLLLSAASSPSGDIKVKKTGTVKGAVIYSHSKHAAKIGDKAKDCSSCHVAVKSKETAHKFCAECHKTMKSGPGLAKCNDCHKSS
jgi:hypothetical protein